jgi:hypothetical protein
MAGFCFFGANCSEVISFCWHMLRSLFSTSIYGIVMKLLSIDFVIPVVLIITSDHYWLLGTIPS